MLDRDERAGQLRYSGGREVAHRVALVGEARRWHVAAVVAGVALAACSGTVSPPRGGGPAESQAPGTAASDVDARGEPATVADGPITVTMEGGTYAYSTGRCEIIDDVVYVTAVDPNLRGAFEATLPAWEREIAYAQRLGGVRASHVGGSGSGNFELVAGRSAAGTTWEWSVSGANVEVVARMGNSTTATREAGRSRFTEYRDVTIDISCSGGPFGPAVAAAPGIQDEFVTLEPSLTRAPGSVTVELDGATYQVTYLSTCDFFQQSLSAEGIANEASIYLYSEGRGVHLDLLIGDQRTHEEGVRWSLPPDVDQQDDFLFEGFETSRSWSGEVISEDGRAAQAAITVDCTEGDAFTPAGSASVTLDGVTHVLDQVMTCTIDGTTIDFFGRSSESDVAIVVTDGGSQILLGDESGRQTLTGDVVFEVVGQQANWAGTLAGNRQSTVAIDCGQAQPAG